MVRRAVRKNTEPAQRVRTMKRPHPPKNQIISQQVSGISPTWDSMARQLRLGDRIVKQFRRPAPNQELILAAFQEESWPSQIWDPLPRVTGRSSKTRRQVAIRHLNAAQYTPIIRFYGNGGDMICWRLA